jgi:hypothetical protein
LHDNEHPPNADSETERICAFYSHGPHFRRLLRYLRHKHPEAQVTALIPPDYPERHIEQEVDVVERTSHTREGMSTPKAFFGLLRQIRRGDYDRLVIMFDSPRLRILAALTGIPERRCYDVNGRYQPVRLGLVRAVASAIGRNLRGRVTHAYIRWVVNHRPVENPNPPPQGD